MVKTAGSVNSCRVLCVCVCGEGVWVEVECYLGVRSYFIEIRETPGKDHCSMLPCCSIPIFSLNRGWGGGGGGGLGK